MQTITKCLAVITLVLAVQMVQAQDTIPSTRNQDQIKVLIQKRSQIEIQEKEALKQEVEAVNERVEKGEISVEEAYKLKQEYAQRRALNIENKLAIIDNKIELLKRNDEVQVDLNTSPTLIRIGGSGEENTSDDFIYIGRKEDDKPRKYDKRTTSDLVIAFGFNNAIIEGSNLDDSPYKFGGSRFFEIGWAWKTRMFKETNFLRLKYGVSLQINGLKPKDNQYFVQDGDLTYLEEFSENLDKSKLSVSNLVFPVHFEFGPSRKIERDNYFRYSTRRQFKIGIGGYGGFNIGTRQKLKYDLDGDRKKDKIKRSYNTSNLVYGLSSYLAFGDVGLYVKYDLSPIFKDQPVDQNNISLGLRFDMD